MTKRTDCKRFRVIPHVGVKDNLTGEIHSTYKEFAKALNKESERADRIAEEYYDFRYPSN